MASTTKKDSKKSKAKPRGAVAKKSQPKQAQNVQSLQRALDESFAREAATSDILHMIASSPAELQPVLDAIAERAARLCDAEDAAIFRLDGNFLRLAAHFGPIPMSGTVGESGRVLDRGTPAGRAIIDRQTIHVHDLRAADAEFPEAKAREFAMGLRTVLDTPLLREGIAIGAIHIRRREVRPFSDRQIKLLETFADQAVIAIENARLFQELTHKTTDLEIINSELREALEQQTATSQILGVIASSPTDIQPVLDVVAENAARLCEATDAVIYRLDGDSIFPAAVYGNMPPAPRGTSINRETPVCRAIVERQTVHTEDLLAEIDTEFPDSRAIQQITGTRSSLATPLLREGVSIGAIHVRRSEVRPFTDKQVALLKTFADQAVIAIENVRLFKEIQERNAELREALEHQTATSEVLGIISRSPTDVQPVLDAIVESAARVCGIDDVVLRLREGDTMVQRAHFGPIPLSGVEIGIDDPRHRWMREHGTLHIPDIRAQNDFPTLGLAAARWRTYLAAPLRLQGDLIGTLGARRIEVRLFTPAQIKLLETFADQAVIAIENVRLFKELEARNRDLTEALEQQTATSEILRVIASSPTDIQPVLDVVAENAARLCDASNALIYRVIGDSLQMVAQHGPVPAPAGFLPISRGLPTARGVVDRQTIHVHDLAVEKTEFPESQSPTFQQLTGTRTILVTPLLREGVPIGVITIRRQEVRPFTNTQINLLQTFADQAVIAIENVRLFQELEARTRELAQSVGELRALGEVGQAVSSTLELETVLTRIASHAVQLSGADGGAIYEYDEATQEFQLRGSHQIEKELVEALHSSPIQLGSGAVGQAAMARVPVEVTDILDER
jgi:GAF domain-containing protein